MMKEVWKDIPGYEGFYQASTMGRIRTVARRVKHYRGTRAVRSKILKPIMQNSGYLNIGLHKHGKSHVYRYHKIIALTILGECPEGYQINHIDLDKTNNRPDNLEYVTPYENTWHGIENGARDGHDNSGENNALSVLTEEDVLEIRRLYAQGGIFQWQLGEMYGVSRSTIQGVVNGTTWKHLLEED